MSLSPQSSRELLFLCIYTVEKCFESKLNLTLMLCSHFYLGPGGVAHDGHRPCEPEHWSNWDQGPCTQGWSNEGKANTAETNFPPKFNPSRT